MKKSLLIVKLLILAIVFSANAQINFENLTVPNYWNGSDETGSITSGNCTFINYYNSDYQSWAGFAASKTTDTETSGLINQYSAITGKGYNNTENYIVSYVSSFSGTNYIKLATAEELVSVNITNNTFANNSMRDGDAYTKQFGSTTDANGVDDGTNGEDWFLLTIKGFNTGVATADVEFYLADYRFTDEAEDYIVNTWEEVDLSSLSTVDSIVFELTSSDNGDYGMNTPAYFCLDNLVSASTSNSFEDIALGYWNGSDETGMFSSDIADFYNSYNSAWGSWSGFSYSNKADITTAGYSNQYSAITGEDYNGEGIYAVANGNPGLKLNDRYNVTSLNVTNSAYAALSMQNGDMYAKQFGSTTDANGLEDGTNGEDWFLLTIKGYDNGTFGDSVNFYLADYRFADNAEDYIVNTWEEVDLTTLGSVDSLSFHLSSSDVGNYGMNTPAYFCFDQISYTEITNINDIAESNFNVYPNPVKDILVVEVDNNTDITISDMTGKVVYKENCTNGVNRINMTDLSSGIYFVSVLNNDRIITKKVVKK